MVIANVNNVTTNLPVSHKSVNYSKVSESSTESTALYKLTKNDDGSTSVDVPPIIPSSGNIKSNYHKFLKSISSEKIDSHKINSSAYSSKTVLYIQPQSYDTASY